MKKIKKITIKIATVNAAFFNSVGAECIAEETAGILRSLAASIDDGSYLRIGTETALHDANGNVVGFVRVR